MKKVLILPDIHLDHRFPLHPSYNLTKKFIRTFKPEETIILGDYLDFSVISKYAEEKPGELFANGIKYDLSQDIVLAKKEIDYLNKYSKKVTLLEGNHDRRIRTYGLKNPEIQDAMNLDSLLDLKSRGVDFIPEEEQPYRLGGLSFIHGWYYNKYAAAKTLIEFGGNIVFGHIHRIQTYTKRIKATGDEIAAWSLGCLTDKEPGYSHGRPNSHVNGFGICYISDDGNFSIYPIHINDEQFIFGGKQWKM